MFLKTLISFKNHFKLKNRWKYNSIFNIFHEKQSTICLKTISVLKFISCSTNKSTVIWFHKNLLNRSLIAPQILNHDFFQSKWLQFVWNISTFFSYLFISSYSSCVYVHNKITDCNYKRWCVGNGFNVLACYEWLILIRRSRI